MEEITEEYYKSHSIVNEEELSFFLGGCSTCKKYDACPLNEFLNESKSQLFSLIASNIIKRKNEIPECDNYIYNSPYTKKESLKIQSYEPFRKNSINLKI